MLLVLIILAIVIFSYLEIVMGLNDLKPTELCKTPLFILLRITGEVATMMFFTVGLIISYNIDKRSRAESTMSSVLIPFKK